MKIALGPCMIRHLSLPELCRATAELGYDQIELSPRADFLDWWVMPRATKDRMAAMLREASPLLAHVRVADTFNHKKSSQLRYIVNPPAPPRSVCTSIWTSARARSTGTCFSRLWARWVLTA